MANPKPERKIVTVVGARPQFVKASAVSPAFKADGRVREVLVHTGQHFDANMSDVFFAELAMAPPDHHLEINSGTHGAMTGRMLECLEAVILAEKPDGVMVYGDTNSTLAGALAAAKLGLPVFHVEAGLRSFLKTQPEEINRVLTDHVSTLLFCPSQVSVDHLAREGITKGVIDVGDVMREVAAATAARVKGDASVLARHDVADGGYVLATIHRQENTDDPVALRRAIAFLKQEAQGLPLVLPLHPRTRQAIARHGIDTAGMRLTEPLGYCDMTRLILGARRVLTDSGGLQKEAYWHRVPCITLRATTEWQETIDAGWNRLWTDAADRTPRRDIPELDRMDASRKIVGAIADLLG